MDYVFTYVKYILYIFKCNLYIYLYKNVENIRSEVQFMVWYCQHIKSKTRRNSFKFHFFMTVKKI